MLAMTDTFDLSRTGNDRKATRDLTQWDEKGSIFSVGKVIFTGGRASKKSVELSKTG